MAAHCTRNRLLCLLSLAVHVPTPPPHCSPLPTVAVESVGAVPARELVLRAFRILAAKSRQVEVALDRWCRGDVEEEDMGDVDADGVYAS